MVSVNCKQLLKGITSFSFYVSILCSVFVTQYPVFDNCYAMYPMSCTLLLGILILGFHLFYYQISGTLSFNIQDVLFIAVAIYMTINYDVSLRLSDWKIEGIWLLLLLWFTIRIWLSYFPEIRNVVLYAIIFVGSLQAVWGLAQLYEYIPSNHVLFPLTGAFYNPGPYSGYIAIVIPVCLYQLMSVKGKCKYLLYFTLFLMISTIPAGMSRSAWLGVLISCLWVIAVKLRHKNRITTLYNRISKRSWIKIGIITSGIIVLLLLMFVFKKDSANGRLFIWKNTIHSITERPWIGYGIGTFPYEYGKSQAEYFSQEVYSSQEERVAGSPEYAFNEYLHCILEGGIVLLLLVGLLLFFTVKQGIHNSAYAALGGILSLFIFAMTSYPFQIFSFWVMVVLLMAVCVSSAPRQLPTGTKNSRYAKIVPFCLFLLTIGIVAKVKNYAPLVESWNKCRLLMSRGAIKPAARGYLQLYADFRHNSSFLFEYALCLIEQKHYNDANTILRRAALVSNDAMIYNLMGENYQKMKLYKKAEACFLYSTDLLPGRIYPYYLLTLLYTESSFYQPEKMEMTRQIVLTKQPKINSKAIEEMRENVKNIKFIKHEIPNK